MKISEQLKERIQKDLGIAASIPGRVYASPNQRSQGAWSWYADMTEQAGSVGSAFTMTQCIQAKRWKWFTTPWGDIEITPLDIDPLEGMDIPPGTVIDNHGSEY